MRYVNIFFKLFVFFFTSIASADTPDLNNVRFDSVGIQYKINGIIKIRTVAHAQQ